MGYGGNGEHSARPPALFVLDLGANGGSLAPTTVEKLRAWIEKEVQAWLPFFQAWQQIPQGRNPTVGSLKNAVDWARQPLNQAHAIVQKVIASNGKITESDSQTLLQQIKSHVQDAFSNRLLPHTASTLGKRLLGLSAEPVVALGYAFAVISEGHNQLLTQGDANVWRGFLMGLQDRHGVITDSEARLASEKEALSDLRAKAESALTQKELVADELHRRYESLESDIANAEEKQKQDFTQLLEKVNAEHAEALLSYKTEMSDLTRAFKDGMALRGPVEYWSSKATLHQSKSTNLMRWSFGSIAILTVILGGIAWWIAHDLKTDAAPAAWKVSVLVLVGVLGVWVVRLVIRMWLSHAHLATDANERVTMVQTYLALIEDGKMTKDEDRALVLTPLFRPAADGLVKDEGLPHPMLEMLTRSGRN
jgi:hypothetical protein